MRDDELAELGVAAAAAAIRYGDVTAESYAGALLRRAREHDELNSFITINESLVRTAAEEADSGPLHGVPIGVKDSYLTKGLRTTLGVATLDDFVPDADAEVVAALKDAGGVVFGKNNLVEMSFGLTGKNHRYGQVRNPHDRNRVSGGSSSGSAAAVAARLVPAALGGDTVGSIRVPASLCGVVGFKPTTGRWPSGGVAPISTTLDTAGVLARSVEDCALIDRIVVKDVVPSRRSDLTGARFAYAPRHYLELIDPEVDVRFKGALARLRDAGAEVVEVDLGQDFSALADRLTWRLFFRETWPAVAGFLRRNDFPVSFEQIYDELEPGIKEVWRRVVLPSGPGYLAQEAYDTTLTVDRPELQRRFGAMFTAGGFDALILPTTPGVAPVMREPLTLDGQEASELALARNTVPASGAGLPGISIPFGRNGNGLPIGIELDGAHGRDRELLDLARCVESVFA